MNNEVLAGMFNDGVTNQTLCVFDVFDWQRMSNPSTTEMPMNNTEYRFMVVPKIADVMKLFDMKVMSDLFHAARWSEIWKQAAAIPESEIYEEKFTHGWEQYHGTTKGLVVWFPHEQWSPLWNAHAQWRETGDSDQAQREAIFQARIALRRYLVQLGVPSEDLLEEGRIMYAKKYEPKPPYTPPIKGEESELVKKIKNGYM